jgi:hypothetical protein
MGQLMAFLFSCHSRIMSMPGPYSMQCLLTVMLMAFMLSTLGSFLKDDLTLFPALLQAYKECFWMLALRLGASMLLSLAVVTLWGSRWHSYSPAVEQAEMQLYPSAIAIRQI